MTECLHFPLIVNVGALVFSGMALVVMVQVVGSQLALSLSRLQLLWRALWRIGVVPVNSVQVAIVFRFVCCHESWCLQIALILIAAIAIACRAWRGRLIASRPKQAQAVTSSSPSCALVFFLFFGVHMCCLCIRLFCWSMYFLEPYLYFVYFS
jgi:hypothetical protein